MMVAYHTLPSYFSQEGWLEVEKHESDLRGSRGICLVRISYLARGEEGR